MSYNHKLFVSFVAILIAFLVGGAHSTLPNSPEGATPADNGLQTYSSEQPENTQPRESTSSGNDPISDQQVASDPSAPEMPNLSKSTEVRAFGFPGPLDLLAPVILYIMLAYVVQIVSFIIDPLNLSQFLIPLILLMLQNPLGPIITVSVSALLLPLLKIILNPLIKKLKPGFKHLKLDLDQVAQKGLKNPSLKKFAQPIQKTQKYFNYKKSEFKPLEKALKSGLISMKASAKEIGQKSLNN